MSLVAAEAAGAQLTKTNHLLGSGTGNLILSTYFCNPFFFNFDLVKAEPMLLPVRAHPAQCWDQQTLPRDLQRDHAGTGKGSH